MPIAAPPSMEKEHEEIWHLLIQVQKLSGKTGSIAESLAANLKPHIDMEESLALPLLGILRELVNDKLGKEQSKKAAGIFMRFEKEYPGMLHGHKAMSKALDRLKKVGGEEGHLTAVRFAEKLERHSQEEEEVFYPAALLAGRMAANRTRSREIAQTRKRLCKVR